MDDDISLSEEGIIGEGDEDELPEGDTWIEELECALLADCDPTILKKISEGKRIPSSLRADFWRALLALNEAGPVRLCTEFDLENQLDVRRDCEKLVVELSQKGVSTSYGKQITEVDALRLTSCFESTITTYVKARPELSYIPQNGWTDILKVLYQLDLNDSQLYQMFFRIVDRYIPKDLSQKSSISIESSNEVSGTKLNHETIQEELPTKSNGNAQAKLTQNITQTEPKNSVQAYHLLRLLIQYHDPALCSMLDSKKVTPNLYVKDWFCSLFARSCSPQIGLLIWDAHFKMADPFLIFFAAIVMVVNASDELKQSNMDKETMLKILKTMPARLEEDDIEDLYYLVSNHYTSTTPRSIRSYSHLFFLDTFGNTYLGNESPVDGCPLKFDLKTSQLTSQLDLSQFLCLPIVPAEIFAFDSNRSRSTSPDSPMSHPQNQLRYFLVDCRPAEQYNAGHLKKAFHLDCSLMLLEPSSFTTAVNVLLDIQRQVVASKSNTGGKHLCFIGSGHEDEDQYVNMVVASFLQKYQSKYVSIVVGGFGAIHDYVSTKTEFKDRFDEFIVDHDQESCKICYSKSPDAFAKYKSLKAQQQSSASIATSAQQLFTSTASFLRGDKTALSKFAASHPQTSQFAQSGASMLDKFTKSFVIKSNVIKDKLVETLQTSNMQTGSPLGSGRGHVSSQDKLGRRYTGSGLLSTRDSSSLASQLEMSHQNDQSALDAEPVQEVELERWQKESGVFALYKCFQIKDQARYPGYVGVSHSHLWILREIPHNKGFASIAGKRPLDTIVQITSKRRQQDMIIFRYGFVSKKESPSQTDGQESEQLKVGQGTAGKESTPTMPTIIGSDHLHIPQPFEVIRLIKREIIRIMDQNPKSEAEPEAEAVKQPEQVLDGSNTPSKEEGVVKEDSFVPVEEEGEDKDKSEVLESAKNEIPPEVETTGQVVTPIVDLVETSESPVEVQGTPSEETNNDE